FGTAAGRAPWIKSTRIARTNSERADNLFTSVPPRIRNHHANSDASPIFRVYYFAVHAANRQAPASRLHQDGKRETRCETLTDFASFRCGSLVRFRAGDRQISQPTRPVDALLVDAQKRD